MSDSYQRYRKAIQANLQHAMQHLDCGPRCTEAIRLQQESDGAQAAARQQAEQEDARSTWQGAEQRAEAEEALPRYEVLCHGDAGCRSVVGRTDDELEARKLQAAHATAHSHRGDVAEVELRDLRA